ncbi:hypothetical protein BKA67DRAFT_664755 [Truncatella angustata]|uniref:Uncharacterized protein n=1 Tax=Truncatella angustata TaxID=152316 RepID=A0A9P8UC50_9PEZI|nr:uncharacterized protein BKA67DRAFT_664755 [Truncatella angustata]KAH6645740.1 hypothetical protein BKA67DRAFT_664755 [Truncatella angustata]
MPAGRTGSRHSSATPSNLKSGKSPGMTKWRPIVPRLSSEDGVARVRRHAPVNGDVVDPPTARAPTVDMGRTETRARGTPAKDSPAEKKPAANKLARPKFAGEKDSGQEIEETGRTRFIAVPQGFNTVAA